MTLSSLFPPFSFSSFRYSYLLTFTIVYLLGQVCAAWGWFCFSPFWLCGFGWHCQLICTDAIPGEEKGKAASLFPQAASPVAVISCQTWNLFPIS